MPSGLFGAEPPWHTHTLPLGQRSPTHAGYRIRRWYAARGSIRAVAQAASPALVAIGAVPVHEPDAY